MNGKVSVSGTVNSHFPVFSFLYIDFYRFALSRYDMEVVTGKVVQTVDDTPGSVWRA